MANQERHKVTSPDLDVVTLHLVIPIGAAGAPGTATYSRGFVASAPLTHGSTGQYTVNLLESWIGIVGWTFNNKQASFSSTGACEVQFITDSVKSAGTFVVECTTEAGAAVDPASGDVLYLTIDLQMTAQ